MPQLKKSPQLKYNAKNATWCVVFFSAENVAEIYFAAQDYLAENSLNPNVITDYTYQMQLENYILTQLYTKKLTLARKNASNKLHLTKLEATILVKKLEVSQETLLCLGKIAG